MNTIKSVKYHLSLFFLGLMFFQSCSEENKRKLPFDVKKDLFDTLQPNDLGLKVPKGIETYTIFKPTDSTDHFSNGAVMTAFKGVLYCQWQSSAVSSSYSPR